MRRADDKERAIGLVAAPVAGGLSFLIINTLIRDDPPVGSRNYVNPSIYHSLLLVLLGLAVLMLVTALLRKRLFLGIVLALFGLAVFNLHYWGFGVPFLLAGAWYLVRAYRLQQELKRAGGGGDGPGASEGEHGDQRRSATTQQAVHPTDVGLGPRRRFRSSSRRARGRNGAAAGSCATSRSSTKASTAGRMNTLDDECCVVHDADGGHECRVARYRDGGHRRTRTVEGVPRGAARCSGDRRGCRCRGTSSRRRCSHCRRAGRGNP